MRRKVKTPEISRLIEFMRSKNMKAAELAASIDMPERTLTNYIWTDKPLRGQILRKLAAVHGLSLDWLVSGVGEMFAGASGLGDKPITDHVRGEFKPLIPYIETTDLNDLSDYWWLVAKAIEQSLMQSGAVPGHDYSLKDCYELAQPFVLERFKTANLEITVA